MPKVRILDALSEQLSKEFCQHLDVRDVISVVYQKTTRIAKMDTLLDLLRIEMDREPWDADDRVVLLTCRSDHNEVEPLCLDLLEEFSELIVYDIGEHLATRYRKPTQRARMTIDEVLAELKSLARPRSQHHVVPREPWELDRD